MQSQRFDDTVVNKRELARVMGIDFGTKRIGVALADESRLIASAHSTIVRKNKHTDLGLLLSTVDEFDVDEIVVGLPRNMDGSYGPAAQKAQEFAKMLADVSGKRVIMQDERLSTVSATRTLLESGMSRSRRKQTVDRLAAQVILQAYLDRVR